MMVATAGLSLADKVGLAVTLIGAVGAAVASCLAAWRTGQTRAHMRLPSNGITQGAAVENTAVNLAQLVHLVADDLGKRVSVPTPRQTQAQAPGSTLADPPPAATDVAPATPPVPGP